MMQKLVNRTPGNIWRTSVVEEPQLGVHQSDALLVTGVNHNLISSGACWSCNVLNTTLQERNISKDL